jgi:hypothetical protein
MESFGYTYPNYDVQALAYRVCRNKGWVLAETRFYTGVPPIEEDPFWHHFWAAKLAQMSRTMIVVFRRPLRYAVVEVKIPGHAPQQAKKAREKGIDVRIALDMVRAARENRGNILLVFSQDQDLSEAVDEVKEISRSGRFHIRVASAFPYSPTSKSRRGIEKTDWIQIDKATYDACIDHADYRLPRDQQPPPPP